MKRTLPVIALLLAFPITLAACLWDRDTPSDEAKGLPDVVAVLTGRFPRNPPLYYQMRLDRGTAHLKSHPDDLAAFDDAGVACDRLGRGDEAIAWMDKKKQSLDRMDPKSPDLKEHLYRYHANLGTFLVHRWVRQGRDRAKIDDVKRSRDEIAAAIKINPNAHFGREKYQLSAIEWIIDPPTSTQSYRLPNLSGFSADTELETADPKAADDAVRGLAGLIVLGNAWESVDIFHALVVALQHDSLGFPKNDHGAGRNALAYLAYLRTCELIDAGKRSMLPDAPDGEALKRLVTKPRFVSAQEVLDGAFPKLRAEADAWQKARTEFMVSRLNTGRHPDTDPAFWNGYKEAPAPGLPAMSVKEHVSAWTNRPERLALLALESAAAIALTAVVWKVVTRCMRNRRKPQEAIQSSGVKFNDD